MAKKITGKKIRLAMLRCDTHGYWYGPFLAKCDPYLLQKHDHELLAARQPSGMSRPGYAGYLSQAVKVHGSQGGGKGQSSGAPFKVGRPAP